MLIPLGNARHDLRLHVLLAGQVSDPKPLALRDTEPLFDLIHPGAVRRGKGEPDAWMSRYPLRNLWAMLDAHVVAHHLEARDARRHCVVERC